MRDKFVEHPSALTRALARRFSSMSGMLGRGGGKARLSALLTVMGLAGCAAPNSNPFTVFADPGKYQFHSCDQIIAQRNNWSTREQELRALMNKARQDTGGVVVNVLAYKADHVAASEELKVLEATARSKNCDAPASRGNSATR